MQLPNIRQHLTLKVIEAAIVAVFLVTFLFNQWQTEKGFIMNRVSEQDHKLSKLMVMQVEEMKKIREEMSGMIKKVDDIEEKDLVMKILINSRKLTADQIFELADIIPERCKALKIPTKGFLALMRTESDYNSNCIFMGAKGICQVMDITRAEAIGVTDNYKWNDPITNTLACLLYLEYIRSLPQYKSADFMDLARAYNRGPFHKDQRDTLAMRYQRKIEYYMSQM